MQMSANQDEATFSSKSMHLVPKLITSGFEGDEKKDRHHLKPVDVHILDLSWIHIN